MRTLWVLGWLLVARAVGAQTDVVTATTLASHEKLTPGMTVRLAAVLDVAEGWHINANPPGENLIATELSFVTNSVITVAGLRYPKGEEHKVGWADLPLALYSGKVTLQAEVRVAAAAKPGPLKIAGNLKYQACDNEKCRAPKTIALVWEIEIVADAGTVKPAHPEIFGTTSDTSETVAPTAGTPAADNAIESLVRERGWTLALIFIFVGGLALNLTPCVYPMIAITVSYFGGQGEKKVGAAFAHALVYCLGIVLTYSIVGLVAALTGGLFGALLQSPVVLIGIAVLLVALALSMFGLYEIQPPAFLMQKAAGLSSQAGFIGVFLLGATVGIIAAPCIGPIILGVFVFVAQRGDPWLGWWMFFVLALGLGLPYVVLGTFSGLLVRLPKSGTWMVWVKRVFGVALIGVAVWFVLPLFGTKVTAASPIGWQPYQPQLIAQAGKPVLIDFSADWCIPCHEMDKKTFQDPRIVAAAKQFVMLRADLTRTGAPDVQNLTDDFKIIGVPTFVFFNAAGQELPQLRRVGFIPADEFLQVMQEATTAAPATNATAVPNIPSQLLRPF